MKKVKNKNKFKPVVALYVRVSTNTQDKGAEAQELKLRQYCEYQGIADFKLYIDKGISGARKSRPQFNKMMKAVESGEVNTIITYSLSRISRSMSHLSELLTTINKHDITFISITENIDTKTASGKLLFNIMGSLAEFERETISERVKNGLANAKAKGVKLGASNPKIKKALKNSIRTNDKSLDHAISVYNKYLVYMINDGITQREMASRLTKMEVLTVSGKKQWSLSQLQRLLKKINHL